MPVNIGKAAHDDVAIRMGIGVRIPIKLARQLHLKEGSVVDLKIEDDHMAIYPKKYNLEQMLTAINESNIHEEIFNDELVGKEKW